MSKAKTKTDYRSAETGKFVTERFAERHPKETVKERNPVPSPSGGKSKK